MSNNMSIDSSSGSDDSGSFEDEDFSSGFSSDFEDQELSTMHEAIIQDAFMYDTKVSFPVVVEHIDVETRISLNIDISDVLTPTVAKGWGVSVDEPLIIQFSVHTSDYLDSDIYLAPIVTQKKAGTGRVTYQLWGILKEWIPYRMSQISNKDIMAQALRDSSGAPVRKKAVIQKQSSILAEPRLTNGFLYQIYEYTRFRLQTLPMYCVLCGQPSSEDYQAFLLPAVCQRSICVFAYTELQVAGDTKFVCQSGKIMDLLALFTRAAANSPRSKDILTPFPLLPDLDPKKQGCMKYDANRASDHKAIAGILNECVSPSVMAKNSVFHDYAVALFSWISSSNRCLLVELQEMSVASASDSISEIGILKEMKTPYQFLMLSAPPAKEEKFKELKKKHGSIFAFHGSGGENWHSILRNGLYNASGTKYQLNGAAYGSGVYLSPTTSVSKGYSRRLPSNVAAKKNLRDEFAEMELHNFGCIALCEVIDKMINKNANKIWVVPDVDHVVTRFLFVYDFSQQGSSIPDIHLDTDAKLTEKIKKLMNFYSL